MKVKPAQFLYATKLFVSVMLAFVAAARLGVPQPYWAMVTCCVLMNQVSGAIWSKAAYRFTATLAAGIVALLLGSLFASIPALMLAGAGIVATLTFGIGFLDRTPRAYSFQMFAITLIIIVAASMDHPEHMFDTAVARLTEISIGILSVTLVDSIIAPRSLDTVLRGNLRRWISEIERWIEDVLHVRGRSATLDQDRLRAMADITSLSQLTGNLHFDATVARHDIQVGLAIQQRLLKLVILLSAIEDRLQALGSDVTERLSPALADIRLAIEAGKAVPPSLIEQAREMDGAQDAAEPWRQLIHHALANLLTELAEIWAEVRVIEASANDGAKLSPTLSRDVRTTSAFPLSPDFGLALRMMAGIGVTFASLYGFWMVSGWQQASNVLLIGIVALAFFGNVDEPGKAIAGFGRMAVIASILVAILNYGLLPFATDLSSFILVMSLYMLPLGCWAAVNPMAVMVLAFGLSNINLQGTYSPPDFAVFLEASVASLIGIYAAYVGAGIFRRWGAAHELDRLYRMERKDMARLSWTATARTLPSYNARAVHRIVGLAGRLAATGQGDRTADLLARLRATLHVADLRIANGLLAPGDRADVERVLGRIASDLHLRVLPDDLLAQIDMALSGIWRLGATGGPAQSVMKALTGLRIALFARARAWVPAP